MSSNPTSDTNSLALAMDRLSRLTCRATDQRRRYEEVAEALKPLEHAESRRGILTPAQERLAEVRSLLFGAASSGLMQVAGASWTPEALLADPGSMARCLGEIEQRCDEIDHKLKLAHEWLLAHAPC